MTKEIDTPKPKNSDDHNEWLERQIDKELDGDVWDKVFSKPGGSFGKMVDAEKYLMKKVD